MIRGAQFTAGARITRHVCARKKQYKTKAVALMCAASYRKQTKTDNQFDAYRCAVCRKWHLTTHKEQPA